MLVNAHYETVEFKLPAQPEDARWVLRMDTTNAAFESEERTFAPGENYAMQGRAMGVPSAVLFRAFDFHAPPPIALEAMAAAQQAGATGS